MPVVVDVRSQADYDAWLAEQQGGEAAPAAAAANETVNESAAMQIVAKAE